MGYLHGIDRIDCMRSFFEKRRIGLLSNQTGVNTRLESTVDILNEKYKLTAIFSPEHGFRGVSQAGEKIGSYVDEKTGIPVVSLFGEENENPYSNIDCFVVDIQDVGARFYTYIYTMAEAMTECAKRNIPVVVLDRYNPLGLTKIEGTLLDEKFSSGVGMYELPTRYAMTIGEFAQYINAEKNIGCELHILPCEGLNRKMDYRDIKLPWIMPSPNIPTWETAVTYIGTCLFEGTNMSEGRGTTKPFELIGAPWLKSDEIADIMNAKHLGGVVFRSTCFTPYFSKHNGKSCNGVQLHITNVDEYMPFESGLMLLNEIRKIHTEFEFVKTENQSEYFINELLGSSALHDDNFEAKSFIKNEKIKITNFTDKMRNYRIYE